MIGTSRIIEDDLFGIANRLKALDADYFVVENYKKKRLELHNRAQRGSTLALALPYRVLDERTVVKAYKTRSERAERLIAETENENARRNAERLYECRKKIEREVEKAYGDL
ncbi:MAG: hypothetical protein LBP26_02635 [Clostridiales bacterium]|jgi:hypothetical protein|nr:hypothetical protein [Clostridiales bacterium]